VYVPVKAVETQVEGAVVVELGDVDVELDQWSALVMMLVTSVVGAVESGMEGLVVVEIRVTGLVDSVAIVVEAGANGLVDIVVMGMLELSDSGVLVETGGITT
jgi:hypothetical protein